MATRKKLLGGLFVAAGTAVYLEKTSDNSSWWSSLSGVRFGRAATAVICIAVDYKWTLSRHRGDDPDTYCRIKSELHLRSAQRLFEMCRKNGGTYVKIGQHLGALDYLLPQEYVKTFKIFHTDAPHTAIEKLKTVIHEELGETAEDMFDVIDEEPLGAASLAQCHRGVLKNGQIVAIKIQHPHVLKNGFTDMETVDFLVYCIVKLFPNFQFQWLAEEVRKNLPNELDFSHEAENMRKCSEMFRHLDFIKVPEVHTATKRVLIMEFCEGGKINDLNYIQRNNISVNEVSLKVAKMYSEMIYKHGFIHCDPHPGNILVSNNTNKSGKNSAQITLLDHGLYQQLTDDFRLLYCRLWNALILKDNDSIKRYCQELEAGELYPLLACIITARTWDSIQVGIGSLERTSSENDLIKAEAIGYFSEITQLLNKVPRQLILILKTNDLLRSLERNLGSSCHVHSHITMSKYCISTIGEEEERLAAGSFVRCVAIRMSTRFKLLLLNVYEWWTWARPALYQ